MMKPTDRKGRVTEIIAREAAQFIMREASSDSLITVIRAESAAHGDRILVFISVFPENKIQLALNFLERHREAFSDYLKTHARLRPLPRVEFLLDNREATGAPLTELPKS
jgi:ribosome-binding factor A